eukprot:365529-Chlamydomonas_euryale.AAC.2
MRCEGVPSPRWPPVLPHMHTHPHRAPAIYRHIYRVPSVNQGRALYGHAVRVGGRVVVSGFERVCLRETEQAILPWTCKGSA